MGLSAYNAPSLGVVYYWVYRSCNNRSCRIRCEPICSLIEDCSQISNATSSSKGIDKPLYMRIGLDWTERTPRYLIHNLLICPYWVMGSGLVSENSPACAVKVVGVQNLPLQLFFWKSRRWMLRIVRSFFFLVLFERDAAPLLIG